MALHNFATPSDYRAILDGKQEGVLQDALHTRVHTSTTNVNTPTILAALDRLRNTWILQHMSCETGYIKREAETTKESRWNQN
jgi:hypothetical protein